MLCLLLAGTLHAQPSQQFEPMRPGNFDAQGHLIDQNRPVPSVNENTVILSQGGYDPNAFYVKPANPNAAPKKIANHHVAPPPAEPNGAVRRIYRCKDNSNTDVYADDDNQHKFRSCVKIREEKLLSAPVAVSVAASPETSAAPQVKEHALPTCSGALLYKGSTYVFSDLEPCPIPDEVFAARRPLEANPHYYAPPADDAIAQPAQP